MPYARRRNYRRRPRGRRVYRRKTGNTMSQLGSAWSLAKKAWGYAKYVKSLLNTERKFIDTAISVTPAWDAPTITHISQFTQGDNANERNGRQIKLKMLRLKLRWKATAQQTVRYGVIIANNDDASAPTYGELFETNSIMDHRNMNELQNWKLLFDKTITIDPDFKGEVIRTHNIPLSLLATWQLGTNNATRGNLFLFMISSELAAEAPAIVDGQSRVFAIDN